MHTVRAYKLLKAQQRINKSNTLCRTEKRQQFLFTKKCLQHVSQNLTGFAYFIMKMVKKTRKPLSSSVDNKRGKKVYKTKQAVQKKLILRSKMQSLKID